MNYGCVLCIGVGDGSLINVLRVKERILVFIKSL